jgi:hypothetical protein
MDGVMQAASGPSEDLDKAFKFGGWARPYQDQDCGEEFDRLSEKYVNDSSQFPRSTADDRDMQNLVEARVRALCLALAAAALLVLVPGMASAQSAPSVSIQNITFMRDDGTGQPGDVVTSFIPTDHILHVHADLDQMVVNPNAHVTWTAVDTTAGSNIAIADASLNGAIANSFDSQLSLPQDFPVGTYRVDFYMEGQLLQSANFQVANY